MATLPAVTGGCVGVVVDVGDVGGNAVRVVVVVIRCGEVADVGGVVAGSDVGNNGGGEVIGSAGVCVGVTVIA